MSPLFLLYLFHLSLFLLWFFFVSSVSVSALFLLCFFSVSSVSVSSLFLLLFLPVSSVIFLQDNKCETVFPVF